MDSARRRKETFKEGLRRQTVIEHLTSILREYSSDEQILKELIQNADDAGATEIKFLLDETSYGTKQIYHSDMAKFQGPALYAFNNAVFTDSDWDSLRKLNQSHKEADPTKVGRFGLGFKSVFHITDFPGVVSGDVLAFIDPYEKYFTNHNQKSSCNMWLLSDEDDAAELSRIPDQLEPFCHEMFGVSTDTFFRSKYFNNTLFRFPLRQADDTAKHPWVACHPQKITSELFRSLAVESSSLLLFLNNIENIEIYLKNSAQGKPRLCLTVRIDQSFLSTVRENRTKFKVVLGQDRSLSVCFPMTIAVTNYDNNGQATNEQHYWAVSLYHAGIDERREVENISKELKILPLGGFALPLCMRLSTSGLQVAQRDWTGGQVFCFLQLPLQSRNPTGLAGHVHGCFVLDQNRRNLKWPPAGHDMECVTDPAHIWNIFLKKTVLAAAMVNLAVYLVRLFEGTCLENGTNDLLVECRSKDSRYEELLMSTLMPKPGSVSGEWKVLEERFCCEIASKSVFFYRGVAVTESRWIKAFGRNTVCDDTGDEDRIVDVRRKVLSRNEMFLVIIGRDVLEVLEQHSRRGAIRVTPSLMCTCLKDEYIINALTDDERILMLCYLLEGLSDEESNLMINVSLLPLDNGMWTTFQGPKDQRQIFISVQHGVQQLRDLLPGLNDRFVRSTLPSDVLKKLRHVATQGCLNVNFLKPSDLLRNLIDVRGLGKGNKRPVINNKQMDTVTPRWMEIIWQYLYEHSAECNLASLEQANIHLIPANSECSELVLLNKTVPMINMDGSSDLHDILCHLGVVVLENVSWYVSEHTQIRNHFLPSVNSVAGLVAVLRKLYANSIRNLTDKFKTLSLAQLKLLIEYLANGLAYSRAKPGKDDIVMLKSLPLFQVITGSNCRSQNGIVSIKEVKKSVNSWRTNIPLPESLLDLRDSNARTMASILGHRDTMNDVQVLQSIVIPALKSQTSPYNTSSMVTDVMTTILEQYELEQLSIELQSVRFINNGSGKLATAGELFDDSDQIIAEVFKGLDIFPCGTFSHVHYRSSLKKLGLRGVTDINCGDILKAAKLIHETETEALESRCTSFMKLLDIRHDLLETPQMTKLRGYRWVWSKKFPPCGYPRGLQFISEVQTPDAVSSSAFINLVGSVKGSVDTDALKKLSQYFKWNEGPIVADVAQHMKNISVWYQRSNDNSNEAIPVRRMCEDIYRYLEQCCQVEGSGHVGMIQTLSTVSCIFVENQFILPERCALRSEIGLQCLPLLVCLPSAWSKEFGNLMKTIGVKDEFEADDFVLAFQQLHMDVGDRPLNDTEMRQVSIMSAELYDVTSRLPADEQAPGICLPDVDRVLRSTSELCYVSSDCRPLIKRHNLHVCHHIISEDVAKKLGVKSANERILGDHCTGLRFGQKEKLTNRIKRILTGYPFDKEILKEFVQNADDAGATKLHFILDERHLPVDHVFDENWKQLQGPALCVYNDKPFTEEDIEGIQSLGEGSKQKELTKIGKYGVGFNCVYHITDAPSFLTFVKKEQKEQLEQVLCVFDPLCKYVGTSTEDCPGYMYNRLRSLKETYPDVFTGYLEEIHRDANEEETYGETEGTIFRFPLRQAASKISDKILSIDEINGLFNKFQDCVHESLLFVKSLDEIAIRRIHRDSCKCEDVLIVKTSWERSARKKYETFIGQVNGISEDLRDGAINLEDVQVRENYHELTTVDSRGLEKNWIIVHRLGYKLEMSDEFSEWLQQTAGHRAHKLIPRADVAYLSSSCDTSQNSSETGNNHFQGNLCCFLPLPVTHDLPVHINGHFALEYENRRNVWNYDDGGYKRDWNVHLMERVVAPAYVKLLSMLKEDLPSPVSEADLIKYRDVFPLLAKCSQNSYLAQMTKSAYSLISSEQVPLLPVYSRRVPRVLDNLRWSAPVSDKVEQTAYFDCFDKYVDHPISESENMPTDADILRDVVVASGLQLIISSFTRLFHNFKQAKVAVMQSTPKHIFNFYRTVFRLQNYPVLLAQTPFSNITTFKLLLQYFKEVKELKQKLVGMPLLLTADGRLQLFDATEPKFTSIHQAVVPNVPHQFVHKDVALILKLDSTKDIELCKHFGITEFLSILPSILPHDDFDGLRKVFLREADDKLRTFVLSNDDEHVKTNKHSASFGERWICQVWSFIADEIEGLVNRQTQNEDQGAVDITQRKCQIVQEQLAQLNSWYLLPVVSVSAHEGATENVKILLPVGKAKAVIELPEIKCNIPPDAYSALECMTIPTLNKRAFLGSESPNRAVRSLHDTLFNIHEHTAVKIVWALCTMDYSSANLNVAQSEGLTKYLADCLSEWEKIPDIVPELRRLPLFTDARHVVTRLDCFDMCHIMPVQSIPTDDCEVWIEAAMRDERVVFLKYNSELNDFLLHLGYSQLSKTTLYTQYIFKYFSQLTDDGRISHLAFINATLLSELKAGCSKTCGENCDKHISKCELKLILNELKQLPFIRRQGSSELECASKFYDWYVKVFKAMLDPSDFPPEPFGHNWHSFLCQCGLVSKPTKAHILQFANELSQFQGRNYDEFFELDKKAKVVVKAFIRKVKPTNKDAKTTRRVIDDYSGFIREFSWIAFIPSLKVPDEVRSLHAQHGISNGVLTLVSYQRSVMHESQLLGWTCCPLLPDWATSYLFKELQQQDAMVLLKTLKVSLAPEVCDVVQNIVNVCRSTEKNGLPKNETMNNLREALDVMYNFLNRNVRRNSYFNLKSLPCISIDNCVYLVRPQQVVIELDCEIRPHLFKFPLALGKYCDFFKAIGVAEHPCPVHYASVLNRIHLLAPDILSPNDRLAIARAVRGVLAQLSDKRSFDEVKDLYLPGTDGQLYRSQELIVSDNVSWAKRLSGDFGLHFMVSCHELGLDISHDEAVCCLRALPVILRPHFVSQILEEQLHEAETFQSADSGLADRLHLRLNDDTFKRSIFRLVKHSYYLAHKDEDADGDNNMEQSTDTLSDVRFVECESVVTYLEYKGNSPVLDDEIRAEIRECSKKELPHFIDGETVYISQHADACQSLDSLYCLLADVINRIMDGRLTSVLHHVTVLLRCDTDDIGRHLDECKITPYEPLADSMSATFGEFVPAVGSLVDMNAEFTLCHDMSQLHVGTLAAMELECNGYNYVEVVRREHKADAELVTVKISDEETATVPASALYVFTRHT